MRQDGKVAVEDAGQNLALSATVIASNQDADNSMINYRTLVQAESINRGSFIEQTGGSCLSSTLEAPGVVVGNTTMS